MGNEFAAVQDSRLQKILQAIEVINDHFQLLPAATDVQFAQSEEPDIIGTILHQLQEIAGNLASSLRTIPPESEFIHELNNLLTAASAQHELAFQLPECKKPAANHLEKANKAVTQALHLVNNIVPRDATFIYSNKAQN